jgi:hypothetical protein
MKVYLVSQCEKYAGSYPLGIYSSIELAKKAHPSVNWKLDTYGNGVNESTYVQGDYDWKDIVEHEVDADVPEDVVCGECGRTLEGL